MAKQAASRVSTAPAPKAPRKKVAAPQPQSVAPAARAPSHEEIALRAYWLWAARGFRDGDPVNDWVAAERELQQQLS